MPTLHSLTFACTWGVLVGFATAQGAAPTPRPYVVLTAVAADDPYSAAAQVLVEGRDAVLLPFDPANLEPLRDRLRPMAPRHVALVLRPDQLDFDLGRRFLQLATELDDDPFVDFAFGYITGRTADDAVALATAGITREPLASDPRLAMIAGGVPRSQVGALAVALRRKVLAGRSYYCAGEEAFPDAGRDVAFVERAIDSVDGAVDALTFAGHGYPDEVVGGPRAQDLADVDLGGAVVLNVACYTGVTSRWFEADYGAGVERERVVAPEQSFALAVLGAGVVGYTAYLCPRPAGPELDCDLASLIADGLSLGEARRRDYDKTVLGFLGFGEERMRLERVHDGMKVARGGDVVRTIMLEAATGGILFGDPACVPFVRRDGESPVAIRVEPEAGGLRVRAETSLRNLYLHCSDPTAQMDGTMAMKVHARVPLGDLQVADVVVDDLRIGRDVQPTRVLWVVEDDLGERFLQLKVNFPRGDRMLAGMTMGARVIAAGDGEAGRSQGGEVVRPRFGVSDVTSLEMPPQLLERARQRQVSEAALRAALDASASLLPRTREDGEVPDDAMARFADFGVEGFRAVCALIDVGQAHYRTHELLAATWEPGVERILLSLAAEPALPNHASWAVLRGLGVADTPVVRSYLMNRLASEEDAGLFLSASEALASLGERAAVPTIGDRLLEVRADWAGVAPQLIEVLARLGGDEAEVYLEKTAAAGVERVSAHAESALRRLRDRK